MGVVYLDVSYTINYNANGGSSAPSATTGTKYDVQYGSTFTVSLTSAKPTRTGYTFLGWSESSSATSASYSSGGSYTITANNVSFSTTLYAVWRRTTYTISYNKGANGTGTNTTDTKTYGTALTLKGAIFTRTGYTQTGWSTTDGGAKAYNLSASYTNNAAATLYPYWTIDTYTVSYNKGSNGTGTNTTDTKTYGTALTLKGAIFTRTGYTQTGWSTTDGGSTAYNLNGSYTANAAITLYPAWKAKASTATVTSSVPADGSTTGTVTITRFLSTNTHTVVVKLGTRSQTFSNVGTSKTFTIPVAWLDQIPNSTSMLGTVSVTTILNGSSIGTNTYNFTVTVPASVKPTVSLSGTNQSSNSVVSGWGILVKGYSTIKLTATASAGTGASIVSVSFSGQSVSQTGTNLSAQSNLLNASGSKTWTVTITDSRGRMNSATLTRTIYDYTYPSVSELSAFRSNNAGTADQNSGTYITAKAVYSYSSCNGNNSISVKKIEYKKHTASSWTTGAASASSNTAYTFGGGNVEITSVYDVKVTVTDALGNTSTYAVSVQSVAGVSFGMNGKCARFGGPVQYPDRFECDWPAQFDQTVDIVSLRCCAELSSAGWYRVFDFVTTSNPLLLGAIITLNIVQYGDASSTSANHAITLSITSEGYKFVNEKSDGGSGSFIDKIRVTKGAADAPHNLHVDVHYADSISRTVDVFFEPYIYHKWRGRFNAMNLSSVPDAPSNETVLQVYDFSGSLVPSTLRYFDDKTEHTITIGTNNYAQIPCPSIIDGKRVFAITPTSWRSATGAFSLVPYSGSSSVWYVVGDSGTVITQAKFRYWYI